MAVKWSFLCPAPHHQWPDSLSLLILLYVPVNIISSLFSPPRTFTLHTDVELLSPVGIFVSFPYTVHLHFLDLGRFRLIKSCLKVCWKTRILSLIHEKRYMYLGDPSCGNCIINSVNQRKDISFLRSMIFVLSGHKNYCFHHLFYSSYNLIIIHIQVWYM